MKKTSMIILIVGALLALPATALASGGFATDSYPADIAGSGNDFDLVGGGIELECDAPDFAPTLEAPTHSLATGALGNESCGGWGSGTLKMSDCEFIFHPASESTEIGPPGCGPVKVTNPYCGYFAVGPQTSLTTSGYGLSVTELKISDSVEVSTWLCGKLTMNLSVSWDVAASTEAESLFLYGLPNFVPIGVWLGGESPVIDAQAFPVEVGASRSEATFMEFPETQITVDCESDHVSTGTLSEATGSVDLEGSYEECVIPSLGDATVDMNSCVYALSGFEHEEGKDYGGAAGIECANEGDSIVIEGPLCDISVPGQAIGVSATSGGAGGASAEIGLTMSKSNVEYTSKGFGCEILGLPASASDGVLNQHYRLRGTLPG